MILVLTKVTYDVIKPTGSIGFTVDDWLTGAGKPASHPGFPAPMGFVLLSGSFGSTVNSGRYIETLRARLTRVRPGKNVILHHDNARPHTSRQTQDAMKSLRFYETLPHPSYSPDLAPSDFYLFLKLKEHIKGKHFEDDDAVQEDVRRWFRGKPHEFFADGMRKLIWRWRACVDKEGNYVEN
ncbi:transposase [Elysia marginata]|uniref:Transposase n=1 Tax=Elysia marginata TaxID=1093978 RepID=A0AAV4ESA1_9GAST|nr:transposase [Elysia marginata]